VKIIRGSDLIHLHWLRNEPVSGRLAVSAARAARAEKSSSLRMNTRPIASTATLGLKSATLKPVEDQVLPESRLIITNVLTILLNTRVTSQTKYHVIFLYIVRRAIRVGRRTRVPANGGGHDVVRETRQSSCAR
jgi:hypothetical protein